MMVAALALARGCGTAHSSRRQCCVAASRRLRSASGTASTSSTQSAAQKVKNNLVSLRGRGAFTRHIPHAFGTSSASDATEQQGSVSAPPPGSVHLWLFDPDDADSETLAMYERDVLAKDESDTLRSGSSPMTDGAHAQVIRSKALMRCVLARYLGDKNGATEPKELKFTLGEKGKPYLEGSQLRFSLSHTNKLLSLAVTSAPEIVAGDDTDYKHTINKIRIPFAARFEVGVDCEDAGRRTSAVTDKLAKRWLSPFEAETLHSIADQATRASTFMKIWVLKEAYVKALGTGIAAHPFATFDVEIGEGDGTIDNSTVSDEVSTASKITLVEHTEDDTRVSMSKRNTWSASSEGWRFTLLRVRRGEGLICAVCAWDPEFAGNDDGTDNVKTSSRQSPNVDVRWTLPMIRDFAYGEKPTHDIIGVTQS